MFLLRLALVVLVWLPWMASSTPARAEETVRIGILAKRGEELTVNRWQPTADFLTRKIPGFNFTVVPLDFEEIGKAVAAGDVDFVLANSAIYVDFEMRYGIGRIATMRNRHGKKCYTLFGGVIFARADRDDIKTIGDLAGKRFAAVQDNSLGGYLTAWREMEHFGLTPSKDTQLSFWGTHDAVVYAVLGKQVDAGTVRTDTLERMSAEGKIDLSEIKVLNPQHYEDFDFLSSTRLYPEWPFAKLRHTSESLSHDVAAALLSMSENCPAALAGQIAGWTVPRNYQPVHELMRELRVGPYADLGKITFKDLLRHYWHWLLLTLLVLLFLGSATAYVVRLNLRLREAEGGLIEARDHLAEKVRERTAELEESYRQLERISKDWNDAFDAISDPIFIHDDALRIVQANPAYCERTGHTLEEMIGRLYYEFFPKQDGPLPACRDFPERLYPEGNELHLPNGEIFVSRSFGIKHVGQSVRYAIHILEDVTDVRQAEARRRTLSRALEQAGEGILILGPDRRVLYCNPGLRRLMGRECSNEACSSVFKKGGQCLVKPIFGAQLQQLFDEAERGNSASGEMELAVGHGAGKPAFITVGVIRGEGDGIEGFILTVLDMSEVRQAEQALTYRISLETVISEVASSLGNVMPEVIEHQVIQALQRLGEFAAADRAYVFEYNADAESGSSTHEWCAQGTASQIGSLQRLKLERFPWLRDKLMSGQVVMVPDVAGLPDAAAAERASFQREGIQSLLIVPINYGGVFSGFIGFDNVLHKRSWAEEDVRLLCTAGEIIINSLRRVQAMVRLQRSEASLAAAQHIAHLGNWDWNIVTGELSWSDEIYCIFGLSPQQFGVTFEAFLELVHPDDRRYVKSELDKAVAREKDYAIDHRIILPDGSERTVHAVGEVRLSEAGEPLHMIGTVQDVTELRQAEHEMHRLNRALRALSLCNTTLVHAVQEQTLMDDICRILIENGGYRFVWVGYAENDERKTIRPVAHAGYEHGFLDILNVTWSSEETGQNPAGYAISNKETFIARDIESSEPGLASWREAALERGYASVIALPLISEDETFGAIIIDSSEPDAFDQAELLLVEEMAGDLAFGIRTLRSRRERERAEAALKETEERYEELYENAPNTYVSISPEDGRLLQFNQALCKMLGYDRAALAGMKVFDLYADTGQGLPKAKKIFERFTKGESVRDIELQMRHRDGHPVWVSVSIDPVMDETGKVVESRSSVIDISVRKEAEEEQRRFAEQLQRSLFQTIRAIALTIEKRDPYTAGHQERVAELAVQIGRRMGLDEPRLEGLRLGAMIHDIGKISVPSEILNRPGRLDPLLLNIIKCHPVVGYDIISGIEFPWPLAEMVLQHHERLDGSGYPKGLKGDDILLESRILAVADVVEAMASHRPYRAALGPQVALEEIERGKGTIYDPAVVESCQEVFRDNGTPWSKTVNP